MACFDNIVALKELCTTETPFSGIYLNDIGITKSFITSVITSDYPNIQSFVDDKIRHAIRVIQGEVHLKFGNKINSSSLINNARLGFPVNNMTTQTGSDHKGIQITLNNTSNFINLALSEISLQVNYNGNVPVKIYDLYQNKLIDTVNITAVSGEIVSAFPHIEIKSDNKPLNLFIGYDATGINSRTTYIRQNQCCGITTCTTSYATAKGVTTATGTYIDENMTGISHTAGLSLVYSLSCDPYSWMCSYARVLALSIAYKVGSEMYLHAILNAINGRSSNNTNLNVEGMKEAQLFYNSQFETQMQSVLHNMKTPSDSVCFQCKTPARTAIAIP